MAISFELSAELREDAGKGASRRLRREDKVPAIIYGGKKDPRNITLDQRELLANIQNEAFFSHILTLRVGDVTQECILKDLQRHPFKKAVMHVDLQRIVADEMIRMNIPLHFINEAVAPGVKDKGGVISHMVTDVEIQCLPKFLPEFIEVDMQATELDQVLHLSDLELPEGVELVALSHGGVGENDRSVASCHIAKVMVVEEEPEEGVLEEGEVPLEEGEVPAEEAGSEDKTED
jgi:large subunit ribosomal protein L25